MTEQELNTGASFKRGSSKQERPILFSGAMVRAIIERRKTQTRRVVKPCPDGPLKPWPSDDSCICIMDVQASPSYHFECGNVPYGEGAALWVRETFMPIDGKAICYRADSKEPQLYKWKPSIFMPRSASRITLEISDVRVERVQDISGQDCIAEGIALDDHKCGCEVCARTSQLCPATESSLIMAYGALWDSINFKRGFGWDKNPWVWVIEFRTVDLWKE